jgi:hypothetical protein
MSAVRRAMRVLGLAADLLPGLLVASAGGWLLGMALVGAIWH